MSVYYVQGLVNRPRVDVSQRSFGSEWQVVHAFLATDYDALVLLIEELRAQDCELHDVLVMPTIAAEYDGLKPACFDAALTQATETGKFLVFEPYAGPHGQDGAA